MQRSAHRILTTHCGSLPRPEDLLAMLMARDEGRLADLSAFHARARDAIGECVRAQRDRGLDIVNDGEWSKPDYSTYVKTRLTGFEGEPTPADIGRDLIDFPEFAPYRRTGLQQLSRPKCNGPIAWKDFAAVQRDIDNLKAAVGDADQVFMTAVSPGQVARFQGNSYYKSDEEYLWALAAVLQDEYRAIADAGFTLQIDCPDLGSGWNGQFRSLTLGEFRKVVDLHLDVLNTATRAIPPERMRLHLCWGNYEGPHHHDIPLREIIEPVLRARPAAVSFEGANPRHEHEWNVFEEVKLPDGKCIIPGVIDSTTNFIEHPELVAQRIARYAGVVGRENVIAGVDCGFATFAGAPTVLPAIAWAKLGALAEGARIASQRLWARPTG
jgi:5-methyltetrahydropteroyltriglutamate--homocysteine methyltransferase